MADSTNDGIKIDSRDALEAWLKDRPRDVAQAIATRAALRVLPLVFEKSVKEYASKKDYLLQIRAFKTSLICWLYIVGDGTDNLKNAVSNSANTYIGTTNHADNILFTAYDSARFAAQAAAVFDVSAVRQASAYAVDNAVAAAVEGANRRITRLKTGEASISALSTPAAAKAVTWHATIGDCQYVNKRATCSQLMCRKLWHEMPPWLREHWITLQNDNDIIDAGFSPWFKWYEGIAGLDGGETHDVFGPELSLKIALQPDDWWERGAEEVNADIARWLAEKEEIEAKLAAEIAEIGENPPQQRVAAYRFRWRGGKLAPLPPDPAQDAADAALMLDELRRKATEFAERLTGRNYEPRIARSVELLLAAVPDDLVAVNPGLLRSRGRSIENDAVFFAASEELPEDVKSHLADVAGSLRDLLVCYPQIREKELAARALDLIGADVDQVLRDLAAMRDGAAAADVVAVETVEAFDAMAQAPEDPATFVRSDAGRLWLADRLLVAGNYVAELARGAATVVYDQLATAGTKAGDVWREVRPKIADGAITGLEFIKEPAGYCGLVAVLTSVSGWCSLGLLGYPLLKLIIERLISHLKKLGEKPPDDG